MTQVWAGFTTLIMLHCVFPPDFTVYVRIGLKWLPCFYRQSKELLLCLHFDPVCVLNVPEPFMYLCLTVRVTS